MTYMVGGFLMGCLVTAALMSGSYTCESNNSPVAPGDGHHNPNGIIDQQPLKELEHQKSHKGHSSKKPHKLN